MSGFKERFCTSWIDCSTLCNTEYAALLEVIVSKSIAKNEFFVRNGEVCAEIAFISSGMLRHFHTEAGKEITSWIAVPGSFSLALLSFITGQPSLENIQAIEDTELYCLSRASWLKLCSDFPAFKELWRVNIEAHYFRIEERMHHFISKTAEKRYEILSHKYPQLVEQAPLKYVASMLGVEPRHLSRIRKAKKEVNTKLTD